MNAFYLPQLLQSRLVLQLTIDAMGMDIKNLQKTVVTMAKAIQDL